jgi:TPR repeat protein
MSEPFAELYDRDGRSDPLFSDFRRASDQLRADLPGGLRELERLAHGGSPMSMLALADALRDGRGYATDLTAAEAWYEMAVKSGSTRALVGLATAHLLMGRFGDAIQELEAAIANGYPPAYEVLAGIYFRGNGVPVDRRRARELWRQGASLGHVPAKWNLVHYSIRGHYGLVSWAWALLELWPTAIQFGSTRRKNPHTDRLL